MRPSARALMVSPDRHVLLCRFEFETATVWALPGGGVEPGEDDRAALARELSEEIGMTDPVIGAHVWSREHVVAFTNGLWDGQRERIYVVETRERFEPQPAMTWDELHAEFLYGFRWWPLDEIDERDETASVRFAPRRLGPLVRALLADGPPATPIDTGA